jgi:alcohol dehydrogenase class IV
MTMISYLTRTHFAEAAIEDALPEEIGRRSGAVLLVGAERGARAVSARIGTALDLPQQGAIRLAQSAPRRDAARRILAELRERSIHTLIAVGGAGTIGQARLVAEQAAKADGRLTVIAVPIGLFDFGLSRQVRPLDGRPAHCPRPDVVIADPTVLEPAPRREIAASAMEMLVHAIEAYASPSYNPPADGLALEAVRRLTRWLPVAIREPGHREAYRELMAGALTAGLALEKAIGGVDALANPIEPELGAGFLPGDLHAPLLAAMADFNAQAVGDRYAALAENFAIRGHAPSLGRDIGMFARELGLPTSLRELGLKAERIATFAEMAANDPAALANPRRLTPGDCRRILEAAW